MAMKLLITVVQTRFSIIKVYAEDTLPVWAPKARERVGEIVLSLFSTSDWLVPQSAKFSLHGLGGFEWRYLDKAVEQTDDHLPVTTYTGVIA